MDLSVFNATIKRWGITALLALKQDLLVSGTNIKTINGASVLGSGDLTVSGGATWTETEIDFGSAAPQTDATFTVTDATVTPSSMIAVVPSGKVATGRVGDDWAWDSITFAALPASGSFTVYAYANPGPVKGKRKIQYQVAN